MRKTAIDCRLIAFVFPIKNTFKALLGMGGGCIVLNGVMMFIEPLIGAEDKNEIYKSKNMFQK